MPIVTWNDTYSVKVKEIDLQHKKLVDIINELFDAMKAGKGNTVIDKLLDELVKYTKYHFSAEENYMRKFNFDQSDIQEAQHKQFVAKINDFIEQYKANRLSLSIEMMNFLKDWLINHIVKMDKQYSALFTWNGLK
ncbi:MAG: bacteriohemerythrin [Candidatus Auribacterota bacterium]|jgi:hemerythrin-like metal-binding protein|nr:bacteriohemerythrin [Candidatus Auribacterota bacterium]